jgi:hypothetical protein
MLSQTAALKYSVIQAISSPAAPAGQGTSQRTTLYHLGQQHAAGLIAHTEGSTGTELPRLIRKESDADLECDILAHGVLRLRCGDGGRDKLLAFSCKRRGPRRSPAKCWWIAPIPPAPGCPTGSKADSRAPPKCRLWRRGLTSSGLLDPRL